MTMRIIVSLPILLVCFLLRYLEHSVLVTSLEATGPKRELFYSINEESAVGSYVGDLKQDIERTFSIPNSQLTHFELYDDTKHKYFQVESSTGRLYVKSNIDRESVCPQPSVPGQLATNFDMDSSWVYPETNDALIMLGNNREEDCKIHLSLLAGNTIWVNVLVTVNDINDNEPQFPGEFKRKPYEVNVSEAVPPGYEVPLVGARDMDSGINSVQTYSLRGMELDPAQFSINHQPPFTLNLVILGELDAEKRLNYTGELVACDAGQPTPKCGVQPFRVNVVDENDNKPVFPKSVYEVTVFENLPVSSKVTQLNATDADSGPQGTVHYRFGQPVSQAISKTFGIQPSTGVLYTKSRLNARLHSSFVISVIAEDGGGTPLRSQTVVRITVEDVNDHSPWIDIRPEHENANNKQMLLEENRPAGTSIGLLVSGDDDLAKNSQVVCELRENADEMAFYLEHVNSVKGREMYQVRSNKSFDRETLGNSQGLVHLNVTCSDDGVPKRSTTRDVPVMILDINEYRPKFLLDGLSSEVYVEEGQPTGTFVHQVHASDNDATPSIMYSMSREAQAYLHIDSVNGVITTRHVLDRESTPYIRFNIFVTDTEEEEVDLYNMDDLSRSSTVTNLTVHITDINDNAPELTEKQPFHIMENRPGFSDLVGQLIAIDHDTGNNGTVRYHLLSVTSLGGPVVNDTFMLHMESGKLFTLRSLDRETHSQYELTVLLQDLGSPTSQNRTETITVHVLDENDNKPVWTEPSRNLPQASFSPDYGAFRHRSRLPEHQNIEELGSLNLTLPLFHGQHVIMLTAKDADAGSNANLSFTLLAAYFFGDVHDHLLSKEQVDSQHAVDTQVGPAKPVLFTVAKSTGDLLVGPGFRGRGLIDSGLVELYLRVSDNGHPPLDSVARMFVRLFPPAKQPDVSASAYEKGLFPFFISKNHMGLALIISLIVITGLACCCLICALISFKRKANGDDCCCCCLSPDSRARNESKTNRLPPGFGPASGQLNVNAPMSVEEMFHLGKQWQPVHKTSGSLVTDNASLYRWTPECSGTVAMTNFSQPPIYNFPVDGLIPCRADGEKSMMALLPFDVPCCSSNPLLDDIIFTNNRSHLSSTQAPGSGPRNIMMDYHKISSALLVNNSFPTTATTTTTVPSQRVPKSCSEVDGGSADSGRGASEDEPANADAYRKCLSREGYAGNTIIVTRNHQLRLPELKPLTQGSSASDTILKTPQHTMSMATFTSSSRQSESRSPLSPSNSDLPLPSPPPPPTTPQRPSVNGSYQMPRWQEQLFANESHLGHHNQLFEEFPVPMEPSKINKQSATLPLASRTLSSPFSTCRNPGNSEFEVGQCKGPLTSLERSEKLATLSFLHSKQGLIR